MKRHDLLIIGAGPGGYVAAIRAAQLGMDVGCIDQHAALGGTCLRVGCIPSKALLESSEQFWVAQHGLAQHGVKAVDVTLDLPALMARKDRIVGTLTRGVEALFKKNRVTRYHGRARILGPARVLVEPAEGAGVQDREDLEAPQVIIAAGSKPTGLPGVDYNGDCIGTSTEALAYPVVPEHLVVIGAGYIGVEMSAVWSRLGSKVTVLEYLPRILPGMDSELAEEAQRLLSKQGIEFRLGSRVTNVRCADAGCVVDCEGAEPLHCERVLVAVGRAANTDGLGLETVGIQRDSAGRILVDDHFTTSAKGFYAIGDCIRGPMLAHKASEEGIACVERLATGSGYVNYDAIPAVVYTHPEIASVGKTEDALRDTGRAYRRGIFHFRANGRARCLGDIEGRVKVLADAESDRILGVHIIGPRAGDLIAEAVDAIAFDATSEDIARIAHAHPTLSETLREAMLAVDDRAIHA